MNIVKKSVGASEAVLVPTEMQSIMGLFTSLTAHIKMHLPKIKLSQIKGRGERQSDRGAVSVPVAD